MSPLIYIILLSIAGIFIIFILMNYILQQVVYLPHIHNARTPIDFQLNYNEYFLKTKSMKKIQLWDLNPGKHAQIVLLVHSWSRAADTLLPLGSVLAKNNRVFLLNVRNHGKSDNDKELSITKFKEDIASALDYIRKNLQLTEDIVLLGHSFGAAAAIELGRVSHDIAGFVIISLFRDGENLMRQKFLNKKLPAAFVDSLIRFIEIKNDEKLSCIAPRKKIKLINKPVLLIQGEKDSAFTAEEIKSLRKKLPDGSQSVIVKEADQESVLVNEKVFTSTTKFLKKLSESGNKVNMKIIKRVD
ncbi:MAG: alpha/beta hydrolase [Calditrichaeota bacterium]|nr:alpha/beta hydrolase [Calditrichota bacterium]